MLSLDEKLSPAPGILSHQSGDELVVVLPEQGRFLVLNKTGSQVFQMMDGSRSLREIAAVLSEQYGIPVEQAQRDVLALASKLLERAVIIREEVQDGLP